MLFTSFVRYSTIVSTYDWHMSNNILNRSNVTITCWQTNHHETRQANSGICVAWHAMLVIVELCDDTIEIVLCSICIKVNIFLVFRKIILIFFFVDCSTNDDHAKNTIRFLFILEWIRLYLADYSTLIRWVCTVMIDDLFVVSYMSFCIQSENNALETRWILMTLIDEHVVFLSFSFLFYHWNSIHGFVKILLNTSNIRCLFILVHHCKDISNSNYSSIEYSTHEHTSLSNESFS
jgi:hypothetical protein